MDTEAHVLTSLKDMKVPSSPLILVTFSGAGGKYCALAREAAATPPYSIESFITGFWVNSQKVEGFNIRREGSRRKPYQSE